MSFPQYLNHKSSNLKWLGEIPDTWNLIRLKHLFSLEKRPVREEDGIVTCFRDGVVTLRSKRRTDGFTNAVQEIGYQGIRSGDLIIHAMDAFAGAIGVSDSDGKSSPVYSVCVPRPEVRIFPEYYGKLLRSMAVSGFVTSLAKGIRERSTDFRWCDAGEVFLPVPSEFEQTQIARFLDHETAKIDALIREQERLIKLLQEKRQAVISHAVTKGLDPNVPMKDSRVEWLGDVPTHWDIVALKYLISEKVAGPYGASLTKSMYSDEGYKVFGQQQVISDDFTLGDYYISEDKYDEMRRYTAYPNDILITVMGTIGKVSVVPDNVEPGIINPRLVRYKFLPRLASPGYVKELLSSLPFQERLKEAAQGSTMDGLNMGILGNLPILVPGLEEQKEIAGVVIFHKNRFNSALAASHELIQLLKERRSALISAAVTGKIDVRDWHPPADESAFDEEVLQAGLEATA